MKNIIAIFAAGLIHLSLSGQGIEFADISFYQDSIDPMTIHLVCEAKCQMYTEFVHDGETIIWGDGSQSLVALADTTFQYPGLVPANPLKTYIISHTYSHLYADSIVSIGFYMADGLSDEIGNSLMPPESSTLCPIAKINFAYMSTQIGIQSPLFPTFTFVTDTIYKILYFNPSISYDSSYTLDAQMITAVISYPDQNVGGLVPIQYIGISPENTDTVYSGSGDLIWNHPLFYGICMVSYAVSLYKDTEFVCSMTRDFIIEVYDTSSASTGISFISGGQTLRCYPSPTSGTFTVDMSSYEAGSREVSVYDQLGQQVYTETTTESKLQINAGLSPGIYMVSVTQGGRRSYGRVVVE